MIQMSKVQSVGRSHEVTADSQEVMDALELLANINSYRRSKGLEPGEISPALMAVAFAHVQDLNEFRRESGCNMHSWSSSFPDWRTGCCYTPDHSQADCMWSKGREITSCWPSPYRGNIYENSYSGPADPSSAVNAWKRSSAHNAVILNEGIWSRFNPWPAMGAAIWGSYAVLIFGDRKDPNGAFKSSSVYIGIPQYPHCGPEEYRPPFSMQRTTPAPTTTATTSAAVTSTTGPESFEFLPVDGGTNRACRNYRKRNSPDFYTVRSGVDTLSQCQGLCRAAEHCSGVEFSPGRCELWKEAVGATRKLTGFSCYRYGLPNFSEVDGGKGRACRGATATDNSPKHYQVFEGASDIEACKALCGTEPGCKGIEFSTGRCEVWTRDGGIQASKPLPGFTCLRRA